MNKMFGATTFNVGLSSIASFLPGRGVMDYLFQKVGAGGTLFISNGLSATPGTGYLLGNTTEYRAYGPAQLFLSSVGATTVVQVQMQYTAGYSLPVV